MPFKKSVQKIRFIFIFILWKIRPILFNKQEYKALEIKDRVSQKFTPIRQICRYIYIYIHKIEFLSAFSFGRVIG